MANRKQRSLTDKQVRILETIDVVRDQQARGIIRSYPGAIPTEWVYAAHLLSAFRITQASLRRLVDLGWLEMKPSGGFGPMVRRVPAAPAVLLPFPCQQNPEKT